jgi:hypothetical protein
MSFLIADPHPVRFCTLLSSLSLMTPPAIVQLLIFDVSDLFKDANGVSNARVSDATGPDHGVQYPLS